MAPINLPDGTEVSEVILPDGATASEVIAPDGSTVFSAIPGTEVDRFERGGPVSDRYSGSTGDFAINTNAPVFEGSNSLKMSVDSAESIVSFPGDGLPNYPERSDWIRGYARHQDGDSGPGFVVFAESGTQLPTDLDGYVVALNSGIDELELNRRDGGSLTVLDSSTFSWATGVWYIVDIYSNSSDIQVEVREAGDSVDDPASVTAAATDNTYSGQGFGHRKTNGGGVNDNVNLLANYGLP